MTNSLIEVRNPYPAWQSLAGEMNCWNCYILLWNREDVAKHLCSRCQQTCVAVSDDDDDYNPFDYVEPGLGRIEGLVPEPDDAIREEIAAVEFVDQILKGEIEP